MQISKQVSKIDVNTKKEFDKLLVTMLPAMEILIIIATLFFSKNWVHSLIISAMIPATNVLLFQINQRTGATMHYYNISVNLVLILILTYYSGVLSVGWLFVITSLIGVASVVRSAIVQIIYALLLTSAVFFIHLFIGKPYPEIITITIALTMTSLLIIRFIGFFMYQNKIIDAARLESDKLLLNIFPQKIAEELKKNSIVVPKHHNNTTVLFTDFKGFTKLAEKMKPKSLVEELNKYFSAYDSIIEKYGLEKLKTIGDSYMCASGIPEKDSKHALHCVLAGLDIRDYMAEVKNEYNIKKLPFWETRIGIHSGSLVAGVIGTSKFSYDIWGNTVNTASRLESSGIPGEVNISKKTYSLVKQYFDVEPRGKIEAKNKGKLEMYLVKSIKPDFETLRINDKAETDNG